MMPSANVSSSTVVMSVVTCCHLPRGSVNRKSTYLTSLSLIVFMTFFGVVMACVPFVVLVESFDMLADLCCRRPSKRSGWQFRWRQFRIPPF